MTENLTDRFSHVAAEQDSDVSSTAASSTAATMTLTATTAAMTATSATVVVQGRMLEGAAVMSLLARSPPKPVTSKVAAMPLMALPNAALARAPQQV